jgi:hypothetical protein
MVKRALVIAVAAPALAACGWLAGLPSEYELARDAGVDATTDVHVEAEAAAPEAAAEAEASVVACGAETCNAATRACCISDDAGPACTDRASPTCAGKLQRCDDETDCPGREACCVKSVEPYGVATECAPNCTSGIRACLSDIECAPERCESWSCAGRTVRTCGARGADAGCR